MCEQIAVHPEAYKELERDIKRAQMEKVKLDPEKHDAQKKKKIVPPSSEIRRTISTFQSNEPAAEPSSFTWPDL